MRHSGSSRVRCLATLLPQPRTGWTARPSSVRPAHPHAGCHADCLIKAGSSSPPSSEGTLLERLLPLRAIKGSSCVEFATQTPHGFAPGSRATLAKSNSLPMLDSEAGSRGSICVDCCPDIAVIPGNGFVHEALHPGLPP